MAKRIAVAERPEGGHTALASNEKGEGTRMELRSVPDAPQGSEHMNDDVTEDGEGDGQVRHDKDSERFAAENPGPQVGKEGGAIQRAKAQEDLNKAKAAGFSAGPQDLTDPRRDGSEHPIDGDMSAGELEGTSGALNKSIPTDEELEIAKRPVDPSQLPGHVTSGDPALHSDPAKLSKKSSPNELAHANLDALSKFFDGKKDDDLARFHKVHPVHVQLVKELLERRKKGKTVNLNDGTREVIANLKKQVVK